MLREVLPGAFVLVFLLCMTSFAVALTLGGGPRATTVELAIYQALRFDFDLGRAAWLALIQFALCGGVAVLALRFSAETGFGGGLGGGVRRWDADRAGVRALDAAVLAVLALFLGLPLGAIVLRGLAAIAAGLPAAVWPAAARSLGVALGSAALALALGLALAALIDARRARGGGRLDRGRRADDARRLALRDRHRALHPRSSRSPIPSRWRCRSPPPSTPRWRCPSCCARCCRRSPRRAALDGRLADSLGIDRPRPVPPGRPGRGCAGRSASPPASPPRCRWATSG